VGRRTDKKIRSHTLSARRWAIEAFNAGTWNLSDRAKSSFDNHKTSQPVVQTKRGESQQTTKEAAVNDMTTQKSDGESTYDNVIRGGDSGSSGAIEQPQEVSEGVGRYVRELDDLQYGGSEG